MQQRALEQFSKQQSELRMDEGSPERIVPREERESSSERLIAKLGGTTKRKPVLER